jgi:hypothetical protein
MALGKKQTCFPDYEIATPNAVTRFSFYSNAYYFHKEVFNAKRRKLLLLQEMYHRCVLLLWPGTVPKLTPSFNKVNQPILSTEHGGKTNFAV